MKRKKVLLCGLAIIVYGILVCGCESTVSTESATQTEEVAQQIGQEKTAEQMSTEEVTTEEVPTEENEARQPGLLPEERESIHMGKLSSVVSMPSTTRRSPILCTICMICIMSWRSYSFRSDFTVKLRSTLTMCGLRSPIFCRLE